MTDSNTQSASVQDQDWIRQGKIGQEIVSRMGRYDTSQLDFFDEETFEKNLPGLAIEYATAKGIGPLWPLQAQFQFAWYCDQLVIAIQSWSYYDHPLYPQLCGPWRSGLTLIRADGKEIELPPSKSARDAYEQLLADYDPDCGFPSPEPPPIRRLKDMNCYGSTDGWLVLHPDGVDALEHAERIWNPEGVSDALMLCQLIPPTDVVVSGICGAGSIPNFFPTMTGQWLALRDYDDAGQRGRRKLAAKVNEYCPMSEVSVVEFTHPPDQTGFDLRDYFHNGGSFEELEQFAAAAEPVYVRPEKPKKPEPKQRQRTFDEDTESNYDLCKKEIAKIPDAVAGGGVGERHMLRAACDTVRFDLSDSESMALLNEYNRRAKPPFSESELRHKLNAANDKAERGEKVRDKPQATPHTSSNQAHYRIGRKYKVEDGYRGGDGNTATLIEVKADQGLMSWPSGNTKWKPLSCLRSIGGASGVSGNSEIIIPKYGPLFYEERQKRFQHDLPFVINNLIRTKEVHNFIAAPKTGKSWFALQMAFATATGIPFLGFDTHQCATLLLDNELHDQTLAARERLTCKHFLNGDFARLGKNYASQTFRGLTVDYLMIEEFLLPMMADGAFRPKLIIIDALYQWLGDAVENVASDMRQVFNALQRIAMEYDVAVVVVHHTSKGSQADKDIMDIGAGSNVFGRSCDGQLVILPDEREGFVSVEFKPRSVEETPAHKFAAHWRGTYLVRDDDTQPRKKRGGFRGKTPKQRKAEADDLYEKAREYRRDQKIKTLTRGDLKSASGLSNDALDAAIVRLKEMKKIQELPKDGRSRQFVLKKAKPKPNQECNN